MNLNELTIEKAHQGLKKREFSSVELTEAVLDRIKKRNKDINAYLTISEELALSQARKADKIIANGDKIGPLAGIPLAVKDAILVEGVRCTAASKILESYVAPYDATVIKKLRKAGAVFVGKTNLDEFTMGASGERSAFGPTKNPYDLDRVPGGSSSGSAAAVADNQCLAALGTDTGGSIRQPSSFCGVVGLKPTYGRVSRFGLIAHASSLDQIGPMAKTVEDARLLFNAIKGKDENDSTSVEYGDKEEMIDIKNLKIGVPKEYFVEGIDPEVERIVKEAITQYEKLGAKITEVSLPHTQYAVPCYYIIVPAEASANLARYDGIRYGLSEQSKDLLSGYLKTRQRGFGDEVRRRIMVGTYVLSAGYYDAYYLKAQKVRTLIKRDFDSAFEKNDVLMTPVSPTPAFKIGEKTDNPLAMYLADIYTVSLNLAGVPGLSLPCGKTASEGLPVGLQIIGRHFDEEKIFQVAEIYRQSKNN